MRKNAFNKIWTNSPRQKGPKANHLDLLNTFSSVGFRLLHLQLLPYTSAAKCLKNNALKGEVQPILPYACRSPGMYGFIGSISQSAAMPEFLSSTPGNIALQSHLELLHLAPADFIGLKKQINKFGSWKHGLLNILISYHVSLQRFWHQHRFENPAAFTVDWYLTSPTFNLRVSDIGFRLGLTFQTPSRDLCPISSFKVYTTKHQAHTWNQVVKL